MNNKLALFWIVLMLCTMVLSGCGQTTVESEVVATIPVEVTPDGVVDMEPAAALNAALTYISEHYGEQAPPPGLSWKTELATPEVVVGSSTFEYSAGEWVITVSFPIVAPEYTIYQVEVSNQANGFGWNGEVDARGQVSEVDSMGGRPGKLDPVPPTVSPNTQVIENWYGEVVSNPPGPSSTTISSARPMVVSSMASNLWIPRSKLSWRPYATRTPRSLCGACSSVTCRISTGPRFR